MSIECGICERGVHDGHADDCPKHPSNRVRATAALDHEVEQLLLGTKEQFVDRAAPVPASTGRDGWHPIATAPRDGTNILIRFGQDGVSQAKYIAGLPHPWQFIETNDGITWLINRAVDKPGGPSHWAPIAPVAARELDADAERLREAADVLNENNWRGDLVEALREIAARSAAQATAPATQNSNSNTN